MSSDEPMQEIETLRAKLAEAETKLAQTENKLAEAQDVIQAIQSGEVDAVVVSRPEGDQVFTLQGAEYAYRALVEAMNEGAATLGADGTVLYCNQRLSALLGLPLEQIIGSPVTNLVVHDTTNNFEGLLVYARSGEACKAELEFLSANSTRIPVYVSLREMKLDGPPTLCMVVSDLTERKKRDELIASGRLATSILESAAEAIAVCDESGTIISANEALKNLCGSSPLFQNFNVALPLELNDEAAGLRKPFSISEALRGATLRAQEVRLVCNPERPVSLLLTASAIKASSGIVGCVLTMTDITERKQAEEVLRESERRYSALFANKINAMSQCRVITDEQGRPIDYRIVRINEAYEKMLGIKKADVEGRRVKEVFPDIENYRFDYIGVLGKVATEGGEIRFETYFEATGQYLSLYAYSPLPGEFIAMFSDITERKQAEAALRASEVRFRSVLDSSRDFIYRTNVQTGRYEYISPSVRSVMGFSPDQLMSMGNEASLATIHPDDLPMVRAWLARLEDIGEGELEYRLRAENGELRWLSNHASISKDSAGRPLYRNGNVRDITDRKRAEEALRQNEAMLRAVIEQMPSGVTVRDARTGNLITSNAHAQLLMGRLAVSIHDYSGYAAFHPDGRPVGKEEWPLARSAATGEVVIGEDIIYYPPDGERITLRTNSAPIRDSEGQVVAAVSIFDDISERKRVEEALIRSEKLASVGRMASTIAHEINNPLETIGNVVYLALTDPGIPPAAKSYLDVAVQELDRVNHITRQTLAFHRDTSTPRLVDLRESIEGIVKLFAPRLASREVSIAKRYADVGRISAFSGEIQQVVSNLLSNSLDATPVRGRIELRLSRTGVDSDKIRFTIADTGSGIAPERLAKVFEPFFTTKEMYGTGLGLWVTKQILEKHGATIRVRSKLGSGTVFSIVFPVAEVAEAR